MSGSTVSPGLDGLLRDVPSGPGVGIWLQNASAIFASTDSGIPAVIRVPWSESSTTARPPGRSTRANS